MTCCCFFIKMKERIVAVVREPDGGGRKWLKGRLAYLVITLLIILSFD